MMRRKLTWLGALLLVLTLAACQTTEAPTVTQSPLPAGHPELRFIEVASAGTVDEPDYPTPDSVTWDRSGAVEILGVGLGNNEGNTLDAGDGAEIVVTDIDTVEAVVLQVSLKFSNSPGSAVTFYKDGTQLGDVAAGDAVQNASGWFYEFEYEVEHGEMGDATFRAVVNEQALLAEGSPPFHTPRAFVAFVLRKADPDVQSVGARTYPDVWWSQPEKGYVQTFYETLTLDPAEVDRTVDVRYALAELENDDRPVDIVIDIDDVLVYEARYVTSFAAGGTDELFLRGGTFDLPAGATTVKITVSSPKKADIGGDGGDSVWLKGINASVAVPPPPAEPAIDIEKYTNGEDADEPTGPIIPVGDPVVWTFVVTNIGDVDLTDVEVTDDKLGFICTIGDLAVGADYTCTADGIAEAGQYANIGTVTGKYGDVTVTDSDPSHYFGEEVFVGCTLTRGYWQTHSKYGPAPYDPTWALVPDDGEDTVFFLSGQTYYEVMWTAPRGGNAYYILAPQWIAAYLNVLNGAPLPADVADAWTEAQGLFETYTPAEVGARRFAERDTFVSLAGILDDYNNGLLGVPHCDTLD